MTPHRRFAKLIGLAASIPLLAGVAVCLLPQSGTATQAQAPAADFEPGEDLPGGSATTERALHTRDVFSQFSEGIGLAGEGDFKIGNAIFRKLWVSAPSSNNASDGLGPLYNARGCQNCHLKDGRGRPPAANWPDEIAVSLFLRLSIPPQTEDQKQALAEHRINVINEPTYGGQLQNVSVHKIPEEGQMHIDYADLPVTLVDGTVVTLRKPSYTVVNLNYGPMRPDVMMSPRLTRR